MKYTKTFIDATKDRTYWADDDARYNAVMIIEDDGSDSGGEILAVVPDRPNLIELIQKALEQELS